MATDETRIAQLPLDAAFLRSLPLEGETAGRVAQIAHNLEKFQKFVLDRDAGPTAEIKTEIRHLREQHELLKTEHEGQGQEYVEYRDKTKPMRHENVRLKLQIAGLQKELDDLKKAAPVKEQSVG